MRKVLLAALGGLLVALSAAVADELPPSAAESNTAPAARRPPGEIAPTFGRGLPSQLPWMPPPFPLTQPNDPRVPLPYFSPPPPPSLEQQPFVPGGSRFWGGFEYLMWWDKKAPLPSNFLTTGSVKDAVPGALGQRNTQTIYPASAIDFYQISGLRVTAGGWFDSQQMLGLEGTGFVLAKSMHHFLAHSDALGNPLFAFAHFDPLPKGSPDVFVASEPRGGKVGPFTGAVGFDTNSQLWGAEANFVHALYWSPVWRVRLLGGFRNLDLDEGLNLFLQRATIGNDTVPFLGKKFPTSFELATDSFRTRNQFYGAQIGLDGQYFLGKFFVSLSGKLAAGETHEVLNIAGISTLQQVKKPALMAVGGLFALPSNSGRFQNDQFGVVPETQARLGWQPVRWARGWVGYDFLYWSQVLRPGSQVDLRVNPAQVPTDPGYTGARSSSPAPLFNRTDFWTQGLLFGAELTF